MGATFSRIKTWASGESLTHTDLNAEFDNILDNLDPSGMDDQSSTLTAMRATTDPYPSSSASQATDLAGEIQRIRYVLAQITGQTYWYVDPDKALTKVAPVYRTLWLPAYKWKPTSTAGCNTIADAELGTNAIQIQYLAFDHTTQEHATTSFPMPENWDRSTIKAKFFYFPAAGCSESDVVQWGIQGVAVSNDDAIDATLGTAVTVTDAITAGTSGDLHITSATSAITIGGTPALGDYIHLKVYRDADAAADTMDAEDANLLGVWIQYAIDNTVSAW